MIDDFDYSMNQQLNRSKLELMDVGFNRKVSEHKDECSTSLASYAMSWLKIAACGGANVYSKAIEYK